MAKDGQRVCVIKKGGRPISGFYPNDMLRVFAFRKGDYITFDDESEAKDYLDYIEREVTDTNNKERWGQFSKKHYNIYKKLKIRCD